MNDSLLDYGLVPTYIDSQGGVCHDYFNMAPGIIASWRFNQDDYDKTENGAKVWVINRKFDLRGPKLELIAQGYGTFEEVGTVIGKSQRQGMPILIIKLKDRNERKD